MENPFRRTKTWKEERDALRGLQSSVHQAGRDMGPTLGRSPLDSDYRDSMNFYRDLVQEEAKQTGRVRRAIDRDQKNAESLNRKYDKLLEQRKQMDETIRQFETEMLGMHGAPEEPPS